MQSQSESDDPRTWTWPSILTTVKHTPRTTTTPAAKPDLPSPEQQSLIDSLRTSPLIHPDPDQSDLKSTIEDILSEYEDEDENDSPTSTESGKEGGKEEWQNLHAFLAFITKERIVQLEDVGIHVLRVALERGVEHHYHHYHHYHHHNHHRHQLGTGVAPVTATGRRKKMAVFVSCAAIWALVMGEELWERRGETFQEEYPVGLSLSPPQSVAPQDKGKGHGKPAVSKSRWQMWIDRFQFLSLAEDLDIKTRELAAEAAAVMSRVT